MLFHWVAPASYDMNLWGFPELGEVSATCVQYKTYQKAHHVSQLDIPGIAGLESHLGVVHLPHVCPPSLPASSTDNNLTTEETTLFQGHNSFADHQGGKRLSLGCAYPPPPMPLSITHPQLRTKTTKDHWSPSRVFVNRCEAYLLNPGKFSSILYFGKWKVRLAPSK